MKFKNVIILAIAILTIGLVVACSDDVVTTKDNSLNAYRVVESNGAFVYNGTKYETLQDALDAIKNGKGLSPSVIKVTRNVTGPVAAVAANQTVQLDLDGHTLTFYGVETSALSIGSGTIFEIKNGTMALEDKNNSDLAVVSAKDATALTFNGVAINAAGQYSVATDATTNTTINVQGGSVLAGNTDVSNATLSIADSSKLDGALYAEDSKVTLGESDSDTSAITGEILLSGSAANKTSFTTKMGTLVTGVITAEGTASSSDVTITVDNEVGPVNMKHGMIIVSENGHATMGIKDTGDLGNEYVVTTTGNPYNAITLPEGSTVDINTGICVVEHATGSTYYGSIKEALADSSNKPNGDSIQTIKLLANDILGVDKVLEVEFSVTIDLAGWNVQYGIVAGTSEPASAPVSGAVLTLANGVTLKVMNSSTEAHLGHEIKSATEGTSSLVTYSETTGKLVLEGDINITGNLTDGAGDGSSTGPYKGGSTFKGQITVAGTATFKASTINNGTNTVSAKEVTINDSTVNTTGIANGTGSSDFVLINDSTGSIGFINAGTSDEAMAVVVTNSTATENLTISTINSSYDVALRGPETTYNLTVGGVTSANLIAGYTTFNGNIIAKNRIVAANSTFDTLNALDDKGTEDSEDDTPKQVSGKTLNITSSTFTATTSGSASNFYALEASGEDYTDPEDSTKTVSALLITTSTGTVDSLAANGGGSINVANGTASDTLTVTGIVTASKTVDETTTYYDVTLVGNSSTNVVSVNGTIDGNDIDLTYATVNDNVTAHDIADDLTTEADEADEGSITATTSTFAASSASKAISGSTLSVSNSTFDSTTATYALEASGADYVVSEKDTSALTITTTTGSVASLTATAGSINVDNTNLNDTTAADVNFTVAGNVSAKDSGTTYFDITLKGDEPATVSNVKYSRNVVVTGRITGNDIDLTQTTVNDNVTAKDVVDDATTDVDETDNGSIIATHSTFTPSTGSNKELKGNTISVSNSTFNVTGSYYYALEANGADPDAETSALKLTTSTGNVASLTSTAGSISVDNSGLNDTSTTTAVNFVVTGNVTAYKEATTYYDVTLKGDEPAVISASTYLRNVIVKGDINGNDITLDRTEVNNNVTAHNNAAVASEDADLGNVVATDCVFTPITGSEANMTLTGNTVSVASSTINSNSYYYGVVATGENVGTTAALSITSSVGTAASLTAAAGSISVDNSSTEIGLFTIVGDITANAGNVTLKGGTSYVKVTDDITAKAFNADKVEFEAATDTSVKTVTSETATISNSAFDNSSIKYSITANGCYEEGTYEDYAIVVLNTSGTLNSLSATAGSIAVDNHEASDTLTVDGSVSATSASTEAKVKIVGKTGTTNVVVNGSVSAKTSFSAENTVVGNDKTDFIGDVVYSPAIEISNSKIVLNRIAASETASADTLTITSPVEGSAVANIATDKLDVTAIDANLVVDNVSITGTSTNNTIAGGTYKALTFKGTGVVSSTLTISKGLFRESETKAGDFDFITGTTWIVGKYNGDDKTKPSNYSVYMWGIDNLNSNASIECAYIQSSKLSNLPNIVARVNQTSSDQKIYINYDPYYEDTTNHFVEISSGAPEYNFSTTGMVYDVVMKFDYDSGSSQYSLTSGLFVTGTARPTFKFGNNNISVEGCIFVTGEATLYSTLDKANFVFLATDPDSVTHEWIVALPAEAEGNLFKYKAGSMTLSASQLVVAKNRILIGPSTVGTNVADSTSSYSFKQYYYNPNASASETVYCAKATAYEVAYLENGSILYPVSKNTIVSWGPNVISKFFELAGSSTIWTSTVTLYSQDCYKSSGWTTATNSVGTGYHIRNYASGTF